MQNLLPLETPDFIRVITLLEDGRNVFLTGSAGTGKSYILEHLKQYYGDRMVLTSTTGISAVNIKGQTIHSWAGVECMETPIEELVEIISMQNFGEVGRIKRRIRKCEILAIDEISMLSAYALEYLDLYFRAARGKEEPFGGLQVLLIGDFLQLPPVFTESDKKYPKKGWHCFRSPVWGELDLKPVLLKRVYRQDNINFANILGRIRLGIITSNDMKVMSTCYCEESEKLQNKLHIFPTKREVYNYNKMRLENIDAEECTFFAIDDIYYPDEMDENKKNDYISKIYKRLKKECSADKKITLKVGCRVMLLVNSSLEKGLANGTCGKVISITNGYIEVLFDNGVVEKIKRTVFELQEDDKVIAKRIQFPLKLAYAVTVHKSQGMTFDEIVINCKKAFTAGQIYVALSRVKTLNGLHITGFAKNKLYPDNNARVFYSELEEECSYGLLKPAHHF